MSSVSATVRLTGGNALRESVLNITSGTVQFINHTSGALSGLAGTQGFALASDLGQTLTLSGSNAYSGNTAVLSGSLGAASNHAVGTGDVGRECRRRGCFGLGGGTVG